MDINSIKFDKDGLVPAIASDALTNEVLMLAYMNKEAIEKTVSTGKAHYFSRSRQSLWLKGETSGHFQTVVSIASDCDNDAILMRVIQDGAACHTGNYSCFFNNLTELSYSPNLSVIKKDVDTIAERAENPEEGSYTNYLLNKGVEKICKKIGEEASETIIAAMKNDKNELAEELADLYYHTFVLLKDRGMDIEDVLKVLDERSNAKRKREY